ncbi:hypothetical protein [Pseudomonas aeruginosa]|uniref:hypothetical protein n=1 Tax=Pseudomonas aeruginosa TaxID=287 RepID=UPI00215A07ED|nr:hypothetical protein [Pseudomonas aeruginosa]
MMIQPDSRIVVQFSCGAASAVAGKLALAQYGDTHDVQFLNAYLANEHQDNRRFLADCEVWTGRKITVLRDEKYGADVLNVFRRERYMKGRTGAPCTKLLKRRLLDAWKRPGDVMVLGFTAEEEHRLDDFRERNPDRPVIAPLIERGLGKDDCKAIIARAGIELPAMYRLGYENANCIGCVKGGEGYPGYPAGLPRAVRGPVQGAGRPWVRLVPLPQPQDRRTLLAPRPSRRTDPPQRSHPEL